MAEPKENFRVNSSTMRKPNSAATNSLLAGVLALFDVAPFILLLPAPREDLYTGGGLILLLLCSIAIASLANKLRGKQLRILFAILSGAAAINVLTTVLLRSLPSPLLDHLVLGVLGARFGLDGESAYDAAGYEVWCEIWLGLALVGGVIASTTSRMLRAKA
ncbi:hypothetical protein B0G57_110148 [Trinickia symbiotica]|uniref:Uncharacterized protein n=1 Tax=Trinickia symbiotica TaxID=863227 RepID=A0A2N7X7G3_9BURK|nr:hypothetical protein [Trinickia symbiotica]PMS37521.1 hypothetical protein C0Z20_05980 [Trinickia symbiotica]PPK44074.1 hypothetical protein B0G57_110148 [Trinickia symbiotica]